MDLKLAGTLDHRGPGQARGAKSPGCTSTFLARQKDPETDYAVTRDETREAVPDLPRRRWRRSRRGSGPSKPREALSHRGARPFDKEFAPKLVEVHEIEARLRPRRRSSRTGRPTSRPSTPSNALQLDREIKAFRREVDDQVKFQLQGQGEPPRQPPGLPRPGLGEAEGRPPPGALGVARQVPRERGQERGPPERGHGSPRKTHKGARPVPWATKP